MAEMTFSQAGSTQVATTEEKYRQFTEWAKENGAYIHPSLKFVHTPNRGVEAIIDPTKEAVKPHEIFLRVSYKTTLSYFNAVSAGNPGSPYLPHSVSLPDDFLDTTVDHNTVNAVFLVQQYLLGDFSFWYPYIQIIPQPDDVENNAIPLIWASDDLDWLRGTHLEEAVRKQKKDLELRWCDAVAVLKGSGWDTSGYTVKLGLWAYYIFLSRSFWSIAIEPDLDNLKPEYHILVKCGVNLDDTAKILLPVLDSLNHAQITPLEYHFDEDGLGLAKVSIMEPGDRLTLAYDKDTQRFNNTVLLRDFGFILPDNEACELVLPFPYDLTKPIHPAHSVFSTPATVEEPYSFAEETYLAFVTLRSPSRDCRGVTNPTHAVPALRHFHPTFVSMVSFRVATLAERAALRNEPYNLPSDRNGKATVAFLTELLQRMLQNLTKQNEVLGKPQNQRQKYARGYREEQEQILREVLKDIEGES